MNPEPPVTRTVLLKSISRSSSSCYLTRAPIGIIKTYFPTSSLEASYPNGNSRALFPSITVAGLCDSHRLLHGSVDTLKAGGSLIVCVLVSTL